MSVASSADSALGVLGVDLEANDATAQHDEGLAVDTKNGRAIYAKAVLAAPTGSLCLVAPSSAAAVHSVDATLVSTANVNSAPGVFAINQASIAAGQFGWFYTDARAGGRVRAATGCEPLVPLYVTSTGGVVDDATVSTGRLQGLRVLTSAASASAAVAVFGNITNARTYVA
jgi:hypothetical protein